MTKKELRFYLYLSHPPGIGCQPEGFDIDSREVWMPSRKINGRNCLGRCGWEHPLEPRDIFHYSLRPESELERAELTFWDRDKNETIAWLRGNYLRQPIEKLQRYAEEHHDVKAWAALIILKAKVQAALEIIEEEKLEAAILLQSREFML